MKKALTIALIILGIAGCDKLTSVQEARVEATNQWNATRAQMLQSVATEHLKSGQVDEAIAKSHEALLLDEDCLEARLVLAKALIEKGNYAAAQEMLMSALERSPDRAEAYYLLGVAQERAEKLPEALAAYRRAYALEESHVPSVIAAAEVLGRMGRIREGQLQIESYTTRARNEPGLFEVGGRLAMMNRDYSAAVSHYQYALDIDPRNIAYRESLGRAQFLLGRHRDAVDTLTPLTSMAGRKSPAWVYATLGDCHTALSRPIQARNAYEEAARRMEDSADIRAKLAQSILSCGDLHKAALAAREALTIDPDCVDAAIVLGYAMILSGDRGGAIASLAQAARRHPENGTVWCLLGRAHAAGGDHEQAVRCYTQAVRVDPENALARELLESAAPGALSLDDTPVRREG